MFIAHLPSGYILARLWPLKAPAGAKRWLLLAGLCGAVLPDVDMLWFYLVDNRQTHHHRYFTHWPLLWGLLTLGCAGWRRWWPESRAAAAALLLCAAACLHLLLDSVIGDIWWGAPFYDRPFSLFSVQARFSPWWLNFVLHWLSAVELAICGWAWWLYRQPPA